MPRLAGAAAVHARSPIPLLLTTRTRSPAAVGDYSGVGEKLKPAVKLADGTKLDQVPYAMSDVISLITWIPVLMIGLVLFLGRKQPAPHRARAGGTRWARPHPQFGVIGITIVAAFSASNVLADLGLAEQLDRLCWTACTPRPGSWPSPSA